MRAHAQRLHGHAASQCHSLAGQPADERGHERFKTGLEADEHRPSGCLSSRSVVAQFRREHAAQDAAVGLLQLHESRERRSHAHLLGIAGIDAGHQRLHHAFEGFSAEPTPDKRSERFVDRRSIGRQHEIQAHAENTAERQQTALQKRADLSRGKRNKAFGQFSQASARIDKCLLAGFVGIDQLLGQTELSHEFKSGRLGGQK